jgi:hypothetical protein
MSFFCHFGTLSFCVVFSFVYIQLSRYLLGERLLAATDEQHVVEEDDEHLKRLPRLGHLKRALHQDLPATTSRVRHMIVIFCIY